MNKPSTRLEQGMYVVSRGQTIVFSFCVGAGKNRVWHISHTKVVLLHLEVLALNNLFLATRATLLIIKYLLLLYIGMVKTKHSSYYYEQRKNTSSTAVCTLPSTLLVMISSTILHYNMHRTDTSFIFLLDPLQTSQNIQCISSPPPFCSFQANRRMAHGASIWMNMSRESN